MSRARTRSAYSSVFALAVGLAAAVATPPVRADQSPRVTASMQCDRASEPGRVKCTIEARVEGGTLSWADAELVLLPDFTTALKGRIGPQDATSRDAVSTKWALALVARKSGQGDAKARVRVVVCEGAKCNPITVEVRTSIIVGG